MVSLSVVVLGLFDGDHSVGVVMVVGVLLSWLLVVILLWQLMDAMLVLLSLMKTVVIDVATDGFVIGFGGSRSAVSSGDSGGGFVVDFLGLGGSHCAVVFGGPPVVVWLLLLLLLMMVV